MRCFFIAAVAFMAVGCHFKSKVNVMKEPESPDKGPYYKLTSLDSCEADGIDGCFEEVVKPVIPDGYSLVRLFQNPDVYERISLENMLLQDRKTLEGAAILQVAELLPVFSQKATEAGFTLSAVNFDPLCSHSYSIHNGFFRPTYGTDAKNLKNVICVGKTFSQKLGVQIPMSLDPAIVAHEFYHVLFASDFLSDDKDSKILSVMAENHDLESLSEGLADHFSYTVKREFDSWFIKLLRIFYRDPDARKNLAGSSDFYTEPYRDGQRFTVLNNLLFDEGVDTLSLNRCLLKSLREDVLRALSYAQEKSVKWNRVVSLWDIKNRYGDCSGQAGIKEKFDLVWADLFKQPTGALADGAELSVVVIANRKALCSFSHAYELNSKSFQRYQLISPCSEASSITYKGDLLSFAESEQSNMPTREPVWVTAGLKLTGGGGFDCRLRAPSALLSELSLYADGAVERVGFTLPVPSSKRGSWYRDIPFGSFLSSDDDGYGISGPLSAISAAGFRFTPMKTLEQKPDIYGFNGLILLPSFGYAATDREGKNLQLAERVKSTFSMYYRDSEFRRCAQGSADCRSLLNFFVQCSSHRTALSEESPLGDYKYIPVNKLSVSIYDCTEGGVCSLKTY